MNHDELLAKIDKALPVFDTNEPILWSAYKEYLKALRAVVELHNYFGQVQKDLSVKVYCIECSADDRSFSIDYPCPTIQAIEKELRG